MMAFLLPHTCSPSHAQFSYDRFQPSVSTQQCNLVPHLCLKIVNKHTGMREGVRFVSNVVNDGDFEYVRCRVQTEVR